MINNLNLRTKILMLSLLPVLIACITAFVISNTVVKKALLLDVENELRATASAVLAAYDQNSGDYFQNKNGEVWKGAYNVSLSEALIDDIAQKTGIDITFFYGSQRLVTSLRDADGRRITGSPAGEFLVEKVLGGGDSVFTNRVSVNGTMYFGYYIPVFQNNSAQTIGMIFAGLPVSEVMKSLNLITRVFVISIVVILLLTTVICVLAGNGIAVGIHRSVGVVKEIAGGNLKVQITEKDLQRKDEVGALSASTKILQESLNGIIGTISGNAETLNASSQEMNATATETKEEMQTIHDNLQQVLNAALLQAGNTERVTDSIQVMDSMLENNLDEVGNLHNLAENMLNSSETVKESMDQLNATNKQVLEVIARIQEETADTSGSVEKIKTAVALITDIAEETNLLSLNASIEAARAGESGRGFAIVAQQISKLAEQSNIASKEISEMVSVLDVNSEKTVRTMNEVQQVINCQSENVTESRKEFVKVEDNIHYVADGVEHIRNSTEKLSGETQEITRQIANLRDIAAQNKEHAGGTMQAAENISELVQRLNQMSKELATSATDMVGAVSRFEI